MENKNLLELQTLYINSIINDIYLYIICDKILKNKYVEDIINNFAEDIKHPTTIKFYNIDNHILFNKKILNILDNNNYKNIEITIVKSFKLNYSDYNEDLEDILPNLNYIFKKYSNNYKYGKINDINIKINNLADNHYAIYFSFIFDYNYEFDLNNNSVIDILLEIGEKEKSSGYVADLLYNFIDISKYIEENNLEKYLGKSNNLKYKKYKKSKDNINRYEMEENNDMFVFLCRDDFKENDNGSFTKDIQIERMVKIDPYNLDDNKTISMMKIRETM